MAKRAIRFAVVGTGGMGRGHIDCIKKTRIAKLVAVSDASEESARAAGKDYRVPWYTSHKEMLAKEKLDAICVCSPHPAHAGPATDALKLGVHVLTEKPMAATLDDAEKMVRAAKRSGSALAVMYQQRTMPQYQAVKKLIATGAIGELTRAGLVAAGFRSQAYYDSGAWRGTWDGEGGGVVMNQSPHPLDLFQWFVGMPTELYARTDALLHRIETEDIASIVLRLANGAHGMIHLSVDEVPGTNRWEIAGTKGKIVLEDGARLARLKVSIPEFLATSKEPWSAPEAEWEDVRVSKAESGHRIVVKNFCRHLLHGDPLLVPGEEGLKSQELINAIIMSGQLGRAVKLPIDRKRYAALIRTLATKAKRAGRRSR